MDLAICAERYFTLKNQEIFLSMRFFSSEGTGTAKRTDENDANTGNGFCGSILRVVQKEGKVGLFGLGVMARQERVRPNHLYSRGPRSYSNTNTTLDMNVHVYKGHPRVGIGYLLSFDFSINCLLDCSQSR